MPTKDTHSDLSRTISRGSKPALSSCILSQPSSFFRKLFHPSSLLFLLCIVWLAGCSHERTPNDIMQEMNQLPNLYMKAGSTEEITNEGSQGGCFYDKQTKTLCWRVWTCNNPACAERGRVKFTRENPDVKVNDKDEVVFPYYSPEDEPQQQKTCPECGGTNLIEYYAPKVAQRKEALEQELKAVRAARRRKK